MSINGKFGKVLSGTTRPVATTLSAQKLSGAVSASVVATTGWETTTPVHGIMYRTDAGTGEKVPGSQIDFKAVVSGTTLNNFTVTAGTDDTYEIGTTVELAPTAAWGDDMATGILVEHNEDGTHSNITATTVTADEFIVNGASSEGWQTGLPAPNTVTYNGNRSYDLVFNSNDLTDTVSNGMRVKLARTVTPPTQCTDLESGSSQYWSRASGSLTGVSFTDDFTCMAWIKLESYGSTMNIISRRNATDGFAMRINASGQLENAVLQGGNFRTVTTYQSVPLNKWVHVAVTSNISAGAYTSHIDGISVPVSTATSGAMTAITQAGNLEVGSAVAANFFDGKIAQAAIFSSVLSNSTIQSYAPQTLSGSESTCVGVWKFNGDGNDSNANANNLTANGGAGYATDSPFNATEYGIITANSFSTNTTLTVQVPEGYAIPTSGGVSSIFYSTQDVPYGFPRNKNKWAVEYMSIGSTTQNTPSAGTWYNLGGARITIPIGSWDTTYEAVVSASKTGSSTNQGVRGTLSTANNTESNPLNTATGSISVNSAVDSAAAYWLVKTISINLTSATDHYYNVTPNSASLTTVGFGSSTNAYSRIYAVPEYI